MIAKTYRFTLSEPVTFTVVMNESDEKRVDEYVESSCLNVIERFIDMDCMSFEIAESSTKKIRYPKEGELRSPADGSLVSGDVATIPNARNIAVALFDIGDDGDNVYASMYDDVVINSVNEDGTVMLSYYGEAADELLEVTVPADQFFFSPDMVYIEVTE